MNVRLRPIISLGLVVCVLIFAVACHQWDRLLGKDKDDAGSEPAGPKKHVFVTSERFLADFAKNAPVVNGQADIVSVADGLCMQAAVNAGLTGSGQKWIVLWGSRYHFDGDPNTVSGGVNSFQGIGDGPWYRLGDGAKVADSAEQMRTTDLYAPILFDERGAQITQNFSVFNAGDCSCKSFGSQAVSANGDFGDCRSVSGAWRGGQCAGLCADSSGNLVMARLYCIEQ